MIKQIKTIAELRAWREPLYKSKERPAGKTLSFVPTMGALHEGHLELVRAGQDCADICLPYIFLNPKQFSEGEDLEKYPKTLEQDLEKLEKLGVTHVYMPSVSEVYPLNFQTVVSNFGIAQKLEGEYRPDFFNGVTTVVCKMLLQCIPEIALFGEKDFQQLQVIKKMVKDLNIPVEVRGVATKRDENGLALSSRNAYLSKDDYGIAIQLPKIMRDMANGGIDENQAHQRLIEVGFDKIDYCTARNDETFEPENPNRIFAAVWLNGTRLIDNIAMK